MWLAVFCVPQALLGMKTITVYWTREIPGLCGSVALMGRRKLEITKVYSTSATGEGIPKSKTVNREFVILGKTYWEVT